MVSETVSSLWHTRNIHGVHQPIDQGAWRRRREFRVRVHGLYLIGDTVEGRSGRPRRAPCAGHTPPSPTVTESPIHANTAWIQMCWSLWRISKRAGSSAPVGGNRRRCERDWMKELRGRQGDGGRTAVRGQWGCGMRHNRGRTKMEGCSRGTECWGRRGWTGSHEPMVQIHTG
jgi:hypothetical protein